MLYLRYLCLFSSSLSPVVCWRDHVLFTLCLFSSSLPPVVCRRPHVLFALFVFVCVYWCLTHIMLFLFCQSSSCVPYVANFSGLSILIAPSVFSSIYGKEKRINSPLQYSHPQNAIPQISDALRQIEANSPISSLFLSILKGVVLLQRSLLYQKEMRWTGMNMRDNRILHLDTD